MAKGKEVPDLHAVPGESELPIGCFQPSVPTGDFKSRIPSGCLKLKLPIDCFKSRLPFGSRRDFLLVSVSRGAEDCCG